jgi:vacuolar-type H+-ATPase subunit H
MRWEVVQVELSKILVEFEEVIEQNPKIPMTSKIIISDDVLLDFIDRIRANLPEEIKQANWVFKERERILEEAKQEAEKVVQEAHQYVARMADDSQVVKQAELKAEEIIAKANEVARQIHQGANQYADDILKELQAQLEQNLKNIEAGRLELQKAMGAQGAPGDQGYQEE